MLAKYILVAAAAVVGTVLAQEKCDAQLQFEQCLKTTQIGVDACGTQDYSCLCKAHKVILANCYPLCPKDSGKSAQESTVTSWCVAAGGENESSSSVSVPAPSTTSSDNTSTETSTDTPSTTETDTSDNTDDNDADSTETTGAPEPQETDDKNAAGILVSGAAGVVAAAAAAVMGLVL